MDSENIIPVESIHPFFEWDVWSKDIMEKEMGFVLTHFSMQLTKEKWLIVNASWKLNDEKDRGYLIKYPREGGYSYTGGHEISAEFFFSEIESDPDAYRADYTDIEREYNGFGKVSFDIGIEIEEEESKKHKWPALGYDYAYSQNTKYGVAVYFKPSGFGEIEKTLVEYSEEELAEEIKTN